MHTRHATHPDEFVTLSTDELRSRFLVERLFVRDEVRLTLSHHDRVILGGAWPASGPLTLPVPAELRATAFCDRRELAVVCLSGPGGVTVGGSLYPMSAHDVLYVGRGSGPVTFDGEARFYLVSAPAHDSHPTTLARAAEVDALHLGDAAHANVRTVRRYVHADGIRSSQLVLGITSLAEGSVWNTMPCHTHERRTEAYLYFDLADGERVLHVAGPPDRTRSLVVADVQAVLSPPWSVHFGAGTAHYSFVWAMAGENTAYDDMDHVATGELR
ncbi:4-deoxy-L-threo-5-hexosulose-uronate ketol-isomerase [Longispora fulva]|uniref:4-deoxy-L-threo-5-hexosulose-uronate ketol-isomerase n=1 Tax=Longispora fulva TaxID=619741 RepID=A0A8J7KK51_9ACTN|nr:5-dehydro-4-deoxy-D-glucuronate isomerase [Longispora fulva]MBG6137659.1 4-deoxy-L-threo-5-hexosulose-uronate ketol-isomerase [Longispora fulva]GIG62182.1 4-deoxy-L-threo-5-hexosulose-uronate ketol-isomerase [Longispora fulva]